MSVTKNWLFLCCFVVLLNGNKNFSFKNGLRVKNYKVDIACKQKIRIYHKKYIAVPIKKNVFKQ